MNTHTTTPTTQTPARGAVAGTTTLASYEDYTDAQRLVDRLSDEGFPVEATKIVGSDLRMIEDVTGRKRYGRAALEGAGSGAVTGLIIGLFLALFAVFETVGTWLSVLLSWTLIGAVVGVVLGLIGHALKRGRRDFSSTSSVVAGRFDVIVAADHANDARRAAGLGTPEVETSAV